MSAKNCKYTFFYQEEEAEETGESERTISHSIILDDCTTWPPVVDNFLQFLSSVYGYEINLKKYKGGV